MSVEKEPRRFLTPQQKFIERPEKPQLLEVSGQAFGRHDKKARTVLSSNQLSLLNQRVAFPERSFIAVAAISDRRIMDSENLIRREDEVRQ